MAMDYELVFMGIIALAIVWGVASTVLALRSQRTILSRISGAAGGGSHRWARAKGTATLGTARFDYEYKQGHGHGPSMIDVSVSVASGARFQVKKKDFDSKVFHAIGLSEVRGASVGVLTGDAGFDGRFFLVCDSVETGRRIFSSPGNRDAVRRILERGFVFVTHDGARVAARVSLPSRADDFDPAVVTTIVPILAELAASIRQNARPPLAPDPWRWHGRIAIAVSVLFVVAAFASSFVRGNYPLLDPWDFALASLGFSLPVAALIAVAALRVGKAARLLGYLAGALLALPPLGWWGGACLNGALDRGPPTMHVVRALDKYMSGEGSLAWHHVTVASWRREGGEVGLIDTRLYGVVKPGHSLVAVTTKPGFFGFEWIESATNQGFAK